MLDFTWPSNVSYTTLFALFGSYNTSVLQLEICTINAFRVSIAITDVQFSIFRERTKRPPTCMYMLNTYTKVRLFCIDWHTVPVHRNAVKNKKVALKK